MVAPLTGVTPMYSLCFFGYGIGKKIFCRENSFRDLELTRIGLAGATSGIFTTPILAPLERLKCILQVQNAHPPKPGEVRFKGLSYSLLAVHRFRIPFPPIPNHLKWCSLMILNRACGPGKAHFEDGRIRFIESGIHGNQSPWQSCFRRLLCHLRVFESQA